MRFGLYCICICLVLSGLWFTPTYATARCFSETGYCIDGATKATGKHTAGWHYLDYLLARKHRARLMAHQ